MLVFCLLLLTAARASLSQRFTHTGPVLGHSLEVRQSHPAGVWQRIGSELPLAAGLLDSLSGGDASWKGKLGERQVHRSTPTIHRSRPTIRRALQLPVLRRRSHLNINGEPVKDSGPDPLKPLRVSHSEPVPDNDGGVIMADDVGHRRKTSHFGACGKFQRSIRRPLQSHPIYLGMGHNAANAALTTYLNIFATSSRNGRRASVNPVNFVGKR